MAKKTPGLQKRGSVWHIDKRIKGYGRLCESCETASLEEAERHLIGRLEEIRQATLYGIRPTRTFYQAAQYYIIYKEDKKSLMTDATRLNGLMPYIGEIPIDRLHTGHPALQRYIEDGKKKGLKSRSINHGLYVVRQILNLCESEWIDEHGLTWLHRAPKIKTLKETDLRKPRPITWQEQDRFFKELPAHLATMALFAVNTGLRMSELCTLQWHQEMKIQNTRHTLFILEDTKNGQERIVPLNRIARSIIAAQRSNHPHRVFTYKSEPIAKMNSRAWRNARTRATLDVRVHDLRHTFGRRLRAAGVTFEDRQDLLGHKSTRMTTHYSQAEIQNLIDAVELICEIDEKKPELVLIMNTK